MFEERAERVVVVDGEKGFSCRCFSSFAEVFREFVDDVAGVFFHTEGIFSGDGVVDVHA